MLACPSVWSLQREYRGTVVAVIRSRRDDESAGMRMRGRQKIRRSPHRQAHPGLLGPSDLSSLGQRGHSRLTVVYLLSRTEARSVAETSEIMVPGAVETLHLGGYLIGDLGTRLLGQAPCTNVQISAGDHTDTATMPLWEALAVLWRNLWFSGLRRFREDRCRAFSQLLQIATLAYI